MLGGLVMGRGRTRHCSPTERQLAGACFAKRRNWNGTSGRKRFVIILFMMVVRLLLLVMIVRRSGVAVMRMVVIDYPHRRDNGNIVVLMRIIHHHHHIATFHHLVIWGRIRLRAYRTVAMDQGLMLLLLVMGR